MTLCRTTLRSPAGRVVSLYRLLSYPDFSIELGRQFSRVLFRKAVVLHPCASFQDSFGSLPFHLRPSPHPHPSIPVLDSQLLSSVTTAAHTPKRPWQVGDWLGRRTWGGVHWPIKRPSWTCIYKCRRSWSFAVDGTQHTVNWSCGG